MNRYTLHFYISLYFYTARKASAELVFRINLTFSLFRNQQKPKIKTFGRVNRSTEVSFQFSINYIIITKKVKHLMSFY